MLVQAMYRDRRNNCGCSNHVVGQVPAKQKTHNAQQVQRLWNTELQETPLLSADRCANEAASTMGRPCSGEEPRLLLFLASTCACGVRQYPHVGGGNARLAAASR